ncbi:MAG: hypothetical protein LBB85_02770 [Dysgonamonadaceae bacterium]|nr:hypothetical protein [Dysgonamonadaceae bacterium]
MSCSKKDSSIALFHTVDSFSVPVTSVSLSERNDSLVFIGFENGNIIIKNTYTDKQIPIDAGYNRVYDIKEYSENILLVGVRDEGLKAIRVDNKTGTVLKTYPIAEKETNYGVYSIARDDSSQTFILGTSNGCYILQNLNDAILQPYHEELQSRRHYGFNNVLCIDGKTYIASDSALLVGHKGQITDTLLSGKAITHLFYKNESLYVSTGDKGIWKINIHRPKETSLQYPGTAYGYIKDSLNGQWIIDRNAITYQTAEEHQPFPYEIPQGISTSGKQFVCTNKNFIFLACGDQLLTFPVHQNADGRRSRVIALSKYRNGTVYFVSSDYKLYSYREGSLAQLQGKIKGLEISDNIVQSEIYGDFFWIASNKTLFKINIKDRKLVKAMPINLPGQSQNDIRCLFFDNDTTLYVGSRYNLCVTDPSKNDDFHPYNTLKDPDNDLYVTDICRIAGKLYVSTLNKGLYVINNDLSIDTLLTEKNRYGNIRNLVVENQQLYVHTSKNIYRYAGKDKMNSLPNIRLNTSKYVRSFISDSLSQTVAVVGNHGFAQLSSLSTDTCNELFHRDISFNNATLAFLSDSSLVIGNRSGVYHYKDNHPLSISPEAEKIFPWILLVITAFVLLGIILIIFYIQDQQTRRRRLGNFLKRIENNLQTVNKQVIDETFKERLQIDGSALKDKITKELRKKHIPKQTDKFDEDLLQWKSNIDERTISLDTLNALNKDKENLERNLKQIKDALNALNKDKENLEQNLKQTKDDLNALNKEKENLERNLKQIKDVIKDIFEKMKSDVENIDIIEPDLKQEKDKIIKDIDDALNNDEISVQKYEIIESQAIGFKSRITLLKQKAERKKRIEKAKKDFGLDEKDFAFLEFLASDDPEKKYSGSRQTHDNYQKKIAECLNCKNKKQYIIAKAYNEGLLIPK